MVSEDHSFIAIGNRAAVLGRYQKSILFSPLVRRQLPGRGWLKRILVSPFIMRQLSWGLWLMSILISWVACQGRIPQKHPFITIGNNGCSPDWISVGNFTTSKTAVSLWVMNEEHSYITVGKIAASLGRVIEEHSFVTIDKTAATQGTMVEEH